MATQKEEIWKRDRNIYTGRIPYKDEGRDGSDASVSQGKPQIAGNSRI
jgi:hypothetical protein